MSDSLRCGLILLIALHSGLSSVSGTENVSISCCQGDSIRLFENITFNSSGPVNLYLNGIRQTLIVTWESNQNPSVLLGYKETLFQDEYGTLWIRNIQLSHEGKYILSYKTNNSNEKSEVQVDVMVPPTKECKPKIKKMDSFLIASLEYSECGRPVAYVEWRNQSGISIIENKFLKLSPENEIGTYSACAETPALTCVKTLKISDYCATFTVEGDIDPPVSSEISDTRILTIMMIVVFVMLAIVLIVVPVMAIILKRRRKERLKSRLTDPKESNEEMKPLTIEEMKPLTIEEMKPLTIEEMKPLTIERPNTMLKNPEKSEVEMKLFPTGIEHNAEEATTEHQNNTTAVTTSEIQELRPTVHCKICKINKMTTYYLICDHMAKLYNALSYLPICTNCIRSLPNCALCMTSTRNQSDDETFWTNI